MWAVRCVMLGFALVLLCIGVYASAVYKPPANIYPPVAGVFQNIIRSDKPNPKGDQQFFTQTNNWDRNPDEYYIGVQTHLLYHGIRNVARGYSDGTVRMIVPAKK